MSPENARVFLIDDDPNTVDSLKQYLERLGHSIKLIARSKRAALRMIPTLSKKDINITIVDGNLSRGFPPGNQDGEEIAEAIKAKWPEITVIGHSQRKPINAADINCYKTEGLDKLNNTITKA